MFEKFSREARIAVVSAQDDAKELGAKRIGPEHVLLGTLSNAEPGLQAVLDARGITADGVRTALAARTDEPPLGADDAQALRSIGIDLDAVQASIAENFGPQAWDRAEPEAKRGMLGRLLGSGHIPFTGPAKKTLELALREAIHRKDREITSVYLLLGILRGADQTTVDLLGGRDAVSGVRADLYAMLDRAA
ncbi:MULTISPECIES: Clp protease N-terminal domain-containing protein [Nocardia]|uniref:Clp protease N-terminal domain-containing protein n=1 Tax=Nocardia TaxID=1817 RepID=UPI0006F8CDDC|nr:MULTISPECIES: Clp protease N-terminal domain-containing protein [Nocardia]KQY39126.1 Clp protease [Nocardia sp. Root136]